jgi:hypothetical protein
MKTAKQTRKLRSTPEKRAGLSLYPLDFTTALGAAMQTGRPPKGAKGRKSKKAVEGRRKG